MFKNITKLARSHQQLLRNTQRASYAIQYVKYNWKDPLNFESLLKPEEIQIRDEVITKFQFIKMKQVRNFCQSKLMPRIQNSFRNEKFDREIMNEFGEMGLLGTTIEGYGGSGLGYVVYGLIAREVER